MALSKIIGQRLTVLSQAKLPVSVARKAGNGGLLGVMSVFIETIDKQAGTEHSMVFDVSFGRSAKLLSLVFFPVCQVCMQLPIILFWIIILYV